MRSFVIHMSSSLARQANARILAETLPGGTIMAAVDGRNPQEIAHLVPHPGTLYRPTYPFALRPAEIGVFASHRACWQRILDEDLPHAMIVEDDLAVAPGLFDRALALIDAHVTPDSYIRLPVKQRETAAARVARDGPLDLILPRVIGLQCICQVVGRRAAERLLAATRDIDRPVDTFLQMHWITGQPVHTLLGTSNREIAQQIGGSTIQVSPPATQKAARELRRAWYRAQLALRPQRG